MRQWEPPQNIDPSQTRQLIVIIVALSVHVTPTTVIVLLFFPSALLISFATSCTCSLSAHFVASLYRKIKNYILLTFEILFT